jgi:hypothetical protein
MVDNFEIIRGLLKFKDKDSFYFLQVLKRRKDNPDLGKDMVHIADYYIYDLDQFDKLKPRIMDQCDSENARAYFRLNVRDAKKIAMQTLKRVVDHITSENHRAVKSAYASCTGEFHSDPDKSWIVDIDWKDWAGEVIDREVLLSGGNLGKNINSMLSLLTELQRETKKDPRIDIMPTKNGVHIITRPFNLAKFKKTHPSMDVHKDNPTILYCK